MTFSDLLKLLRHYLKLVVAVPVICLVVSVVIVLVAPPTYIAKAALLTSGDVALAGGFAQSEATLFSQNGIKVTTSTETGYRTINIEAEGSDYGGCIAAANATVLAAAEDCRGASDKVSVTTNEATSAESVSPSIAKVALIALLAGLFLVVCMIIVLDMIKTPIKSKKDVEVASGLPVLGVIPNRDRGERLLANIRFQTEESLSTIAVVPTGLTGATLTCAELISAFENAGIAASRSQGSAHAQGIKSIGLPGMVSVVECAPLSEGMGAVYIAREADMAIICVSEWNDSSKALSAVVEELRFAKANIGGVVFLTTRYSDKSLA